MTGGSKGAKFTLKRLTPVLVLMYLKKENRLKCQIKSKYRIFAASQVNLITKHTASNKMLTIPCTSVTKAFTFFNVNNLNP